MRKRGLLALLTLMACTPALAQSPAFIKQASQQDIPATLHQRDSMPGVFVVQIPPGARPRAVHTSTAQQPTRQTPRQFISAKADFGQSDALVIESDLAITARTLPTNSDLPSQIHGVTVFLSSETSEFPTVGRGAVAL